MSNEAIQDYLAGKKLYGDDFNLEELKKWFEDEKEAYAEIGAKDRTKYKYPYHALNQKYGFSLLPLKRFPNALGFIMDPKI